jgi:hypothetical protein
MAAFQFYLQTEKLDAWGMTVMLFLVKKVPCEKGSVTRHAVGTSEPDKQYSDSLKPWEFLDKLRNYKLLKKAGLSSHSLHYVC